MPSQMSDEEWERQEQRRVRSVEEIARDDRLHRGYSGDAFSGEERQRYDAAWQGSKYGPAD